MSAVWGIIDLNREPIPNSHEGFMKSSMEKYKIDSFKTYHQSHVSVGVGIQFITPESYLEEGPIVDESIVFVTNGIVDNRRDLLINLGLGDDSVSDGRLIYLAYKKFGDEFVSYVRGIFSVIIYCHQDNAIRLFNDHMGCRSLYYTFNNNRFSFGTVFSPILAVDRKSYPLCNKWLTAAALEATPEMDIFEGLTVYEGVYQVGPAMKGYLSLEKQSWARYWDPRRIKVDSKRKSDQEVRETFISLFNACVKDLLRSDKETGITLSSGLDSSSVAAFAAINLQSEGKELYSYTSIPIESYKSHFEKYYVVNEEEGVRSLTEMYRNIIPTFLDYQGLSAYTDMERLIEVFEFPYKAVQNIVWLNHLYKTASHQNCKIVLGAQYGNATISYGGLLTRLYQDIRRGQFRSAYSEMRRFSKVTGVSSKEVLKKFAFTYLEKIKPSIITYDTLVKENLLNRYEVAKQLKRNIRYSGSTNMLSRKEQKRFLYSPRALNHLAAYDTRFGLVHGILLRDPTKDMRLVEYCAALPTKFYVRDGYERALVRRYFRDLLPEPIVKRFNRRGRQGADFSDRIAVDWTTIREEIKDKMTYKDSINLFDSEKIEELLSLADQIIIERTGERDMAMVKLMILYSFLTFMTMFEEV